MRGLILLCSRIEVETFGGFDLIDCVVRFVSGPRPPQ